MPTLGKSKATKHLPTLPFSTIVISELLLTHPQTIVFIIISTASCGSNIKYSFLDQTKIASAVGLKRLPSPWIHQCSASLCAVLCFERQYNTIRSSCCNYIVHIANSVHIANIENIVHIAHNSLSLAHTSRVPWSCCCSGLSAAVRTAFMQLAVCSTCFQDYQDGH